MSTGRRPLSWFPTLFGRRFSLFDHRIAHGRANLRSLGSSRRFSARLGRGSRSSQGGKNWGQRSPNLLRCDGTPRTFPGLPLGFEQEAGQHQQVVSNRQDLRPALKLLRGEQTRLVPQQLLLLKAIGMFHAKAALVKRMDLVKRGRFLVDPHEPTDARILFLVTGSKARHVDHGQVDFPRLAHVQVLPGVDLDAMPALLFPLPVRRRLYMRAGIVVDKPLAVFTWRPTFAGGQWGRTREDPPTRAAQRSLWRWIWHEKGWPEPRIAGGSPPRS